MNLNYKECLAAKIAANDAGDLAPLAIVLKYKSILLDVAHSIFMWDIRTLIE